MVDRHEHLPGLDDRLQRVGELRHDLHLDRGLAVVGAEAGRRVGDLGFRRSPDDRAPDALETLLQRREVLHRVHGAVAHDHVRPPGEHRLDELRDVARVVLVVGVRVDDHVGAQLQAGVEPGLERGGEPLVVGEPHDVVDPVRARDLERAVRGPVVDHEPLDRIDAVHGAWEVPEGCGQLTLLVEAGDLDDQLHAPAGRG